MVPGSTASWKRGRPALSPSTPPPSSRNVCEACSGRTMSGSPMITSGGAASAGRRKLLGGVLGSNDVGVPDDHKRGRRDRLDLGRRPALELAVELVALGDQLVSVLRVGRNLGVRLLKDRAGEVFRVGALDVLDDVGVESLFVVGNEATASLRTSSGRRIASDAGSH